MIGDRKELSPPCLRYIVGILYLGAGLSLFAAGMGFQRYGRAGLEALYPSIQGFDFWDYLPRYAFLHGVRFYTLPEYSWYYPAPAIFALLPFYQVAGHSTVAHAYAAYVLFTLLAFAVAACLFARALLRAGLDALQSVVFTAATALCSWPMYFALQRGNIEAFTWMISALAIWLLATDWLWLSAIAMGIAGSLKIYPLLFAALFLRRDRWRQLLLAVATALVVTVIGLYFLDPNLRESWHWTAFGVRKWTRDYGENFGTGTWDHSLFGLAKAFLHAGTPHWTLWLRRYYLIAGSAALVLYFGARRLSEANVVLLISCAAVSLPPTSFDYTLSLLYIPFAWLVLAAVRGARTGQSMRGLTAVLCLLAFALSCDTWLWTRDLPSLPGTTRALVLLCLLVLSAVLPLGEPGTSFTNRRFRGRSERAEGILSA